MIYQKSYLTAIASMAWIYTVAGVTSTFCTDGTAI